MTDMEFSVLQRIANTCEGIRTVLIVLLGIVIAILVIKIIRCWEKDDTDD